MVKSLPKSSCAISLITGITKRLLSQNNDYGELFLFFIFTFYSGVSIKNTQVRCWSATGSSVISPINLQMSWKMEV